MINTKLKRPNGCTLLESGKVNTRKSEELKGKLFHCSMMVLDDIDNIQPDVRHQRILVMQKIIMVTKK